MKKVLILEDGEMLVNLFKAQLHREPVELSIAATAAAARELFKREKFDVIVLDGIAPSEPGRGPSLVGPVVAKEFRDKGYKRPLVAISNNPDAQALMKRAGCSHLCERDRLHGLIRELLGLWSTTPA